MRIHPPETEGFTLLELLVVIAIIALLAGLLLPVASRIKEEAQSAQCVAVLRNLGTGFLAYAGEHGGKFPPHPTAGKTPGSPEYDAARGDIELAWPYLIADYVGYDLETLTPAVFACPAGIKHPNFLIPALRGYSMNQYVSEPGFHNDTVSGIDQALLLEEWAAPSGTDRDHVMWPVLGSSRNLTYINHGKARNKKRLAWRHNGGMNVLRKDGSVIRSRPGQSGWGDRIVWRIYDDGRRWRDGNIE